MAVLRHLLSGHQQQPLTYLHLLQLAARAERMGVNGDGVWLYSATRMQDILFYMEELMPRALVVDSIQTVYLDNLPSSAGSVVQARSPLSTCHH